MAVFDSLETLLRLHMAPKAERRVYALEFRSSYSAYCGKGAIYKPPSKNQLFESAINKPDRHPCGDFSLDLRHPPIHHRDFKGTIPEERPNGICQYPEHTWYAPFFSATATLFVRANALLLRLLNPVGSPALRSVVQPALGSAELVRLWNSPLTTISPLSTIWRRRETNRE